MKERLNCVMDIGEQMLLSGAEVHRVEDSVNRMCTALGAVRVDCFIITSSMVVTVYGENGGARAKKTLAEFTPTFASAAEFLAYQDALNSEGDRIIYHEDTAEVLL